MPGKLVNSMDNLQVWKVLEKQCFTAVFLENLKMSSYQKFNYWFQGPRQLLYLMSIFQVWKFPENPWKSVHFCSFLEQFGSPWIRFPAIRNSSIRIRVYMCPGKSWQALAVNDFFSKSGNSLKVLEKLLFCSVLEQFGSPWILFPLEFHWNRGSYGS